MFAIALVVFREVFEIALIVGVLMVATRGLKNRGQWVSIGILLGLAGSILIAFFADLISQAAQGMGQELLNATILLIAAGLIGWTTIWMTRHGRLISQEFKQIGQEIISNNRPMYSLAVVVGLAVLREGAEIVMFTYSAFVTGGQVFQLALGALLGTIAGCIVGMILYFGLMKVPTRQIFTVTSWLLILLVAGMVTQAFGYLTAAGKVPEIVPTLWDTSHIVSDGSFLGKIMHVLIGYTDRPSGIQMLVYFLTIGGLALILKLYGQAPVQKMKSIVSILFLSIGISGLMVDQAHATKKVYSPIVEGGELEVEMRGGIDFDQRSSKDNKQKYKYAIGYGVTDRWFTEIYGETEKEAQSDEYKFTAVEFENIYQLFEQGQYWIDAGIYFAYETTVEEKTADKIELKILLEKPLGKFIHRANIIFEKEVGGGSQEQTVGGFAWSSRYQWKKYFEPGIELHSDFGQLKDGNKFSEQTQQLGPVFYGKITDFVKYDVGYLWGLSDLAAEGTFKWILEFEKHF